MYKNLTNKLSILTVFSVFSCFIHAQKYTQTVKGIVTDKDSKVPLTGVNVVILNTNPLIGTVTDSAGRFKLYKVPPGRYIFRFSCLGYNAVTLPEILVSTGKQLDLSIEMEEMILSMKEVSIVSQRQKDKPLNSMATVSARSFNIEETGRYAACINDPARMVQAYAGVAGNGDITNEIIIRGNSPRGLLWRIEGIEVPNPNHFSNGIGNSGGGVSILSNTTLAASDFFSGAFPAEYGNALSGVFDINLRKGNTDKREYAVQVGVLGMEAAAEGPLIKGRGSSYLFNYRYSTLDFLYTIGIKVSGNIIPSYQDFSYKIYLPVRRYHIFTFWGIGGMSGTGNTAVKDSLEWNVFRNKVSFRDRQRMGIAGITHQYNFRNNRTWLKNMVAVSDELTSSMEDTLDNHYNPQPVYRDSIEHIVTRVSSALHHKFNAKNVVFSGLIFSLYQYKAGISDIDDRTGKFGVQLDNKGETELIQGFFQWQYKPNQQLMLNTGVHGMFFLLNSTYSIEPRFGLKWQFAPKQTLMAGIGLHSRVESVSNYLYEERNADSILVCPNRNLGFTRSFHAVAGYDFLIREDIRLKSELYYQYLFRVPVEDTVSSFSVLNYSGGFNTRTLVNTGTGYNYGLELTLEKFFVKSYYFIVTASLFQSKYTGSDKVERNTFYNSNYIFNALAGKEIIFGKNRNNVFNLNFRMIWKGGNRLTPIDIVNSRLENKTVYFQDRAFEELGPAFFRIDLGLGYRRNSHGFSWLMTVDFENLTNRKNIYSEYFDRNSKQVEYNYNLGILPVLNFKLEF